jgi:hypothetical protein
MTAQILFSIRPKWVAPIERGEKLYELRRRGPRLAEGGAYAEAIEIEHKLCLKRLVAISASFDAGDRIEIDGVRIWKGRRPTVDQFDGLQKMELQTKYEMARVHHRPTQNTGRSTSSAGPDDHQIDNPCHRF